MIYFFNTIKDATLYKQQPTQNTGLDEILEISKTYYGSLLDISHPLLQFNVNDISASLPTAVIGAADLILRECESQEIPTDYTIYAYPVSQSWDMGIGTRFDDISSDGATWYWPSTSGSNWTTAGGDFLNSPSGEETISYLGGDIELDMLDIVNQWLSGSIPNNGILLKLSNEFENNTVDYGILQYFGKETNTIYQPKLRIGIDDQSFVTGSLPELTADEIQVSYKRLRSKYKLGSIAKIRVVAREKYPVKEYSKLYQYTDNYYLPTTTWYQIKDSQTDEIIIPFCDYTKVSCDENGNFFDINFKNWEFNRDYYIEIKTEIDGTEHFFSDNSLSFTVEK